MTYLLTHIMAGDCGANPMEVQENLFSQQEPPGAASSNHPAGDANPVLSTSCRANEEDISHNAGCTAAADIMEQVIRPAKPVTSLRLTANVPDRTAITD